MDKKTSRNLVWVVLLALATAAILIRHNRPTPFQKDSGLIFGTVYNVTYQHAQSLKDDIDSALHRFDGSLSMFNDTSTITRVNRGEDVQTDNLFRTVFRRSMEVSRQTAGAFDITVAPLVNAWGFGFKQGVFPDSAMIDSLRQLVGYAKVSLTPDGRVRKQDPRIMLDCSAVAKGYAVDVVASLLRDRGVQNFMVDIGGEVVVSGRNPNDALWRIGINRPVDDSLSMDQSLQTVLSLSGVGIATSGNYRNYYYHEGRKYAHTINPKTGYPALNNLLSATIVAPDCMTADAYATACMVMGLDGAIDFAESMADIDAYFIYADTLGHYQTYMTRGMSRYLPASE